MTTFLTILFVLLAINVLLLIFSVNGAKESIKRPLQRIFEGVILKLLYKQYTKPKYKEAV
jgi:hypothetical protein